MKFEDMLRDRLKSLPKTKGVADQIFNYVSGGYEACDNASLTAEEIESIVVIIKESASLETEVPSKVARFYQESAERIGKIIDTALER